mgnify:CR=1 FL=1
MGDYEKFKEKVYQLTKIDLSSYKERQMKRRIDSLITKAKSNGLKWEKADLDEYRNSSNGTVKKACNIMISTMQRFGWKEDYLLQ